MSLAAKMLQNESMNSERILNKRWQFDQTLAGTSLFAGVDEVGRGCLAGPVVAAAVMLPRTLSLEWVKVDDSKRISPRNRQKLFEVIENEALCVGVGMASVAEIDQLNILHASRLAMGRAIECMGIKPAVVLVDGLYGALTTDPDIVSLPVVDGDARCISIAAASIVAKATRDKLMAEYSEVYPQYGFENHVGYGTKEHLRALMNFGPTPIHRMSFSPVQNLRQTNLGI